MLIEGGETAKLRPPANSLWFSRIAADIQDQTDNAWKCIGDRRSKEFDSTLADLGVLSNLALYHARRIPAAVSYRLFERTKDPKALDDAIAFERTAIDAWSRMVAAAGDFYNDDLMMGVRGANLCGHWKEELVALNKGLSALERQRRDFKPFAEARTAPAYRPVPESSAGGIPVIRHQPVTVAPADKPLVIVADVCFPSGVKWVRLRYRSVNQHRDYRSLPMFPAGEKDRYSAVIPVEHIESKWDLMYFIETMDNQGNGRIYPNLETTTPYIVVRLER